MVALVLPRQRSTFRQRQLYSRVTPPAAMPVPPTVTTGAVPTLGRAWFAASGNASYALASSPRGGVFTVSRTLASSTNLALGASLTVTSNTGATPNAAGSLAVSFLHEGSNLELAVFAAVGMLVRVDGQYISLTPTVIGSSTYYKMAFGSRAVRRIDVLGQGISFIGAYTDWTDTLYPAPVRGPRVLCLGDSFSTNAIDGWINWLTDCTGWDDIWASGVGGTGYVSTAGGVSKKYRDRVATDVIPFAPDIVLVLGSRNDVSQPVATLQTEAAGVVSQIRAALPNCLIVGGFNASGGVETMTSAWLDTMDATRIGFTSAGGVWLNPIEMPIGFSGPVPASTVNAAHAAGRAGNAGTPATVSGLTGVQANTNTAGTTNLPFGGQVIEIGTGATRERINVTSTAVSGGKIMYGFDGVLQYAHAAGEPMTMVGPSYLTGRGRLGATTGFGNSDIYVSADSVHPSPDGHRALAMAQATLLRNYLTSLT